MEAVYSPRTFGIGDGLTSLKANVAANLGRLLRERDLSQRDLAKAIKAGESVVSAWMAAERLPKDHYWPPLLDFFEVPIEELTKDPASGQSTTSVPPKIVSKLSSLFGQRDREIIVRYLRHLAHELGYDLVKLPKKTHQ